MIRRSARVAPVEQPGVRRKVGRTARRAAAGGRADLESLKRCGGSLLADRNGARAIGVSRMIPAPTVVGVHFDEGHLERVLRKYYG